MVECALPKKSLRDHQRLANARRQAPRKFGQAHPGVLIVDDEPYMLDLLRTGLEQEGFDVWLAASGWQALDIYQQHSGEIGAVVLDVCMHGLDGLETLRCLQHVNPKVGACFMSGGFASCEQTELLEAGALRIFWKPFSLDEIAAVLEQLIDENIPAHAE